MARPRSEVGRARAVVRRLKAEYPGSAVELCALNQRSPYELLVATILSAQTTDERVNQVTPRLFAAFPGPEDLAGAEPGALEEIIRPTGFFRAKARSLTGMARGVVERYSGEVPRSLEELVTLPGVGRKTANVVLSVAFAVPGLPVDTHVGRLARRLGFSKSDDPVVVERELGALVPAGEWGALSLRLILHGRQVCVARRPHCGECVLADLCPSAGTFEAPASSPTGRPRKTARQSASTRKASTP